MKYLMSISFILHHGKLQTLKMFKFIKKWCILLFIQWLIFILLSTFICCYHLCQGSYKWFPHQPFVFFFSKTQKRTCSLLCYRETTKCKLQIWEFQSTVICTLCHSLVLTNKNLYRNKCTVYIFHMREFSVLSLNTHVKDVKVSNC